MPIKRRIGKERREGASDLAWAFMLDEPMPEGGNPFTWLQWGSERHRPSGGYAYGVTMRETWAVHRDEALALWIEQAPGTRPTCWWAWDAPRQPEGLHPGCWYDGHLPEPRQRVGGVGTPDFEVLNYSPAYYRGIPTGWLTASEVNYHSKHSAGFRGVAPLVSNPPRFEAEAAYLDRHRLLLPGERARLIDADFSPVTLAGSWYLPQTDPAGEPPP